MSAEASKRTPAPYSHVVWICCCILPPCIAFCSYETHELCWLPPATLFFVGAAQACLVGLVVSYLGALPVTSLLWLLLRRYVGFYPLLVLACAVAVSPFISMDGAHFSVPRMGLCVALAVMARLLRGLAARVRRG